MPFRREGVKRAVKVGLKRSCLLGDLPKFCKAENLIASAVGQNRFLPVDEGMKAPQFADGFVPRPEVQVVRVSQYPFHSNLKEFLGCKGFHRPLGSDREKSGGREGTVDGFNLAQPCPSGGIFLSDFESKSHSPPLSKYEVQQDDAERNGDPERNDLLLPISVSPDHPIRVLTGSA